MIVNNCFRFQDTKFYFKPFEKEVFNFLFDALFRPFRETHRVKGCDKNVSIFLIVRRKGAATKAPGDKNTRVLTLDS